MYKYNKQKFKNDDQMMSCYTVLACFDILMVLFSLVKTAFNKGRMLNPFEKFILCIMGLLLDISVTDLADWFQISKTAAADTFLNLLEFFLCINNTVANVFQKYIWV